MINNTDNNGISPPPYEVDLFDVVRVMLRQKWLILGITSICTVMAVALALRLPRVYITEVIIVPPLAETVEKLNIPNASKGGYLFEVSRGDLYHNLIANIKSNRLRRQFFDNNEIASNFMDEEINGSVDLIFKESFDRKLIVKVINKKGENASLIPISISLEGGDPEQIAGWLNKFIQLADQETITAQTRLFATKVKRFKNSVLSRVESLRSIEYSRRLDRIARLEEAVIVARTLGLIERPESQGLVYEQAKMNNIMSFSLQETPLFLRGVKALQAETEALKQRKNDDPFIPELRNLQEQLNFLSSVKQEVANIHTMQIDQNAIADSRPIKPNRKLIVIIGFVLGVVVSVLAAFVRNMCLTFNKA